MDREGIAPAKANRFFEALDGSGRMVFVEFAFGVGVSVAEWGSAHGSLAMFEHVDLGSVGVSGTVSRELRRVLSSVEALVEDGTLDVGGTLGEAIGVLSRLAGVRVSASVRECDAEIAKCRGEALVERLMRFLNHDYSVRRNDDTLSAWELGVDDVGVEYGRVHVVMVWAAWA